MESSSQQFSSTKQQTQRQRRSCAINKNIADKNYVFYKNSYTKIPEENKKSFFKRVMENQGTIEEAAIKEGINVKTAKFMWQIFRKNQQIQSRKKRPQIKHKPLSPQEVYNSTQVILKKEIHQTLDYDPKEFFISFVNQNQEQQQQQQQQYEQQELQEQQQQSQQLQQLMQLSQSQMVKQEEKIQEEIKQSLLDLNQLKIEENLQQFNSQEENLNFQKLLELQNNQFSNTSASSQAQYFLVSPTFAYLYQLQQYILQQNLNIQNLKQNKFSSLGMNNNLAFYQ